MFRCESGPIDKIPSWLEQVARNHIRMQHVQPLKQPRLSQVCEAMMQESVCGYLHVTDVA